MSSVYIGYSHHVSNQLLTKTSTAAHSISDIHSSFSLRTADMSNEQYKLVCECYVSKAFIVKGSPEGATLHALKMQSNNTVCHQTTKLALESTEIMSLPHQIFCAEVLNSLKRSIDVGIHHTEPARCVNAL